MPANRSSHQSSHVVMPSHHIDLYALVEGKKQCKHEGLLPHEENAGGLE
jgi:hypothetical protein